LLPEHEDLAASDTTTPSHPEAGGLRGYRSGRPFRVALFVVLVVAVVAVIIYRLVYG
jgi:hypothetical protein